MDQFAIVEMMGHRRFGARVSEVEQFGAKMMRAEILVPNADPVIQFVSPSSLYAVTLCDEATARKQNNDAWSLRQAIPGLPAPNTAGPDDIADGDALVVHAGGPEVCPAPCVDCPDAKHHFSEEMVEFADEQSSHPAAKIGVDQWYECKHCDAWREELDDAEVD
jgi:hypothetical protein